MRVLLIEDETELASALRSLLLKHDIIMDHAPTLAYAEEAIRNEVHDALIVDRQLPDGDGITIIANMRSRRQHVPVIVVSARGTLDERIEGLDCGADDYLAKPFSTDELLARLRAVLRRPLAMQTGSIHVGALTFESANRSAHVDGRPLELARRELLILECLTQRAGRAVMRSALEDAVYTFDDEIQSNSLDANISRLRKKLADAGALVDIHGIRGVGYLLRASA
ncbi:response regulator transcription factor [Devosia lacusdianchii]|jgi:DNA-binding response OmpR family regulator|uniref:response regulator transcription factor n=1 Tax=Devosia lacusdianchii TaxID=2917991 RepID=UPI001F063F9D|nr:response regulator transcription factor [Devosia sp. JXJ CY 41]